MLSKLKNKTIFKNKDLLRIDSSVEDSKCEQSVGQITTANFLVGNAEKEGNIL